MKKRLHFKLKLLIHNSKKRENFPLLCVEKVPLFLRTQLKKFLGKSVKKAKHLAEEYGERAVNKVKSVRDEGK